MSYIYPDSTIYLYNNIELDNSYKDTLYFGGIEEQNQYFNVTKPYKFAFLQQMYQRTNKGTLRIEKNAEALYDCNYLRFKNPRTVNSVIYDKWYYAFITNWEYINENVTEITYEIDIMQTYFFDVIVEPSFVVRQMPLTDNLFENLIAEDINIGTDYVVADESNSFPVTPDSIVVMTTKPDNGGDLPYGSIINNVPTSLALVCLHGANLEATIDLYKDWLTNSSLTGPTSMAESIVAVYLLPYGLTIDPNSGIVPSGAKDSITVVGGNHVGRTPPVVDFNIGAVPTSFGSYSPHNYKLLNYPYNYVAVSNHLGDVAEYKYELFNGQTMRLGVVGAVIPQPGYLCFPQDYRGIGQDIDSAISITEFPTIPVTIDGYQQWLTHNGYKMAMAGLGAALTLGAGIGATALTPIMGMAPNGIGGQNLDVQPWANVDRLSEVTLMGRTRGLRAMGNGLHDLSRFGSNIAGILGQMADASKRANGSNGAAGGNALLMGMGRYEFRQYKMQIREFEARKLDTFFDMFGYSMNRVMNVNRNSRPVYNYVKTEGCTIIQNQIGNASSGANANVIADLQKIYDNGITFWKPNSGFNVGDYSMSARNANALHNQNNTD